MGQPGGKAARQPVFRGCTNIALPFLLGQQRKLFARPISNTSPLIFDQLANNSPNEVHMGCQVGKAYRVVLQEGDACFSVLALLLAFTAQARKKSNQKGEESPYDKPRLAWHVQSAGTFRLASGCWNPSQHGFEWLSRRHGYCYLTQMATLTPKHKPTVLGIPGHVPIPYHLECTIVALQSLHALYNAGHG